MNQETVIKEILAFIYESNPVAKEHGKLPLDESLYELGILDSFGIIELVDYIEQHWTVKVLDSEITKEKFGSINKMANLIMEKMGHSHEANK